MILHYINLSRKRKYNLFKLAVYDAIFIALHCDASSTGSHRYCYFKNMLNIWKHAVMDKSFLPVIYNFLNETLLC